MSGNPDRDQIYDQEHDGQDAPSENALRVKVPGIPRLPVSHRDR
jgi:hypothetical protein